MSVEALALTAIIREGAGGLRKCYQGGVNESDFIEYEDEFKWVAERVASRRPLNARVFKRKFPDFEWLTTDEPLKELIGDLRNERAFTDTQVLLEQLSRELEVDNAFDMALFARERLTEISRQHNAVSDFSLMSGYKDHLEHLKQLRQLRDAGEPPGIPTGLAHIDFHWDGLVPGRMIVTLGRPGEGKSILTAGQFPCYAALRKYRTLMVSPEMNRHEHDCRVATILSAMPEVQKAVGLKHSFRNRALMNGIGFNRKQYRRFREWLAEECGEIVLVTGTHRRQKLTTGFIESKIADMAPDLVVIDPVYKLESMRPRNSRIEELSDISDAVQDLAEAYNVPIVVTNQAHRQMSGKDDAPHKDTSFNSDVPIQEADHVIGVKNVSDERRLIVRCSKSRFGQDFRFECIFHPNTGVLKETSQPEGSYYNGHDEDIEDEELREIMATATRGE